MQVWTMHRVKVWQHKLSERLAGVMVVLSFHGRVRTYNPRWVTMFCEVSSLAISSDPVVIDNQNKSRRAERWRSTVRKTAGASGSV